MALFAESTPSRGMNYAPTDLNPQKDLLGIFRFPLTPSPAVHALATEAGRKTRGCVAAIASRPAARLFCRRSEATTSDWRDRSARLVRGSTQPDDRTG